MHEIDKMSILIKSAKIFDANSKFNGNILDILIINGKIVDIGKRISESKSKKIINEKNLCKMKSVMSSSFACLSAIKKKPAKIINRLF